ncbi:hypothetical protein FACS1894187_07420 [Synergistales bacterium]|nr:hypothetical protein FACS1894187_07420 [Synergistales bacterium]
MKKAILLLLVLVSGCLAALFYPDVMASIKFFGSGDTIVIPAFPKPELSRAYIPPSEVPSSIVTVPVKLSTDDLQSLANRTLPKHYNGDVEYLDGTVRGKLNYRLRRESDAKVTTENGRIKISFQVKFNVRFAGNALVTIVRVPFSAQTDGELDFFVTVKPSVGRDWAVKTDAEVDYNWIKTPRLNVAGIQIGLRKETDRFLREAIRDNLYKVDDVINKEVKLRDIMQREWDNLVVPVKAAESVFLHFDPRGIAASPLEITPNEVTLRACVETGISLSMGLGNVTPTRKKRLPSLERYASGDESIKLNVKALLNYDALEREAMKGLSAEDKIDLGITSVNVRSLRLMGSGEKLLAGFEISAGASSGTIYAAGELDFDEETRVLSVKNFGLDYEVSSALAKTAAWLLRPALLKFLSEKLEWKLGSQIDKLTDEARGIIAARDLGTEFEFRGTLESARFSELRVTAQGVEIGLNLEGSAALTYMPIY